MVHLFCLYGPPDMKHVVQMFWNGDEWNMTQPAELLFLVQSVVARKSVLPNNFCVWRREVGGGMEMTELDILLWVLFTLDATKLQGGTCNYKKVLSICVC